MFIYDAWNSMKSLEYLEINLEYKEMYIHMDFAIVNQMNMSKTIKHIEIIIDAVPATASVWAMTQVILMASSDTLESLELSHVSSIIFNFIIQIQILTF